MSSVERVCEVCLKEIPTWKSKGTTVCSVTCRFERRKQKAKEANGKRKADRQLKDSILFHNCFFGGGGESDPFVPSRCKCRKFVSEEEAQSFIALGEAIDFETRVPAFTGRAIVQIGKLKRTPRSATVEKAHISRLVEKPKTKANARERTLEELQAAVKQDQAERFEEEKWRLEIYGELNTEFLHSLIREVSADQYDHQEREAFGRPGIFSFEEERTSHGVDVVSLDVGFDDGTETEEIEFSDVGDEIEVDDEQQNANEPPTEALAEYEEIEHE